VLTSFSKVFVSKSKSFKFFFIWKKVFAYTLKFDPQQNKIKRKKTRDVFNRIFLKKFIRAVTTDKSICSQFVIGP
jgi:hypothetical protein